METLKRWIEPVSKLVQGLDLSRGPDAEEALNKEFPPASETFEGLAEAARRALEAGTICDRKGEGFSYSRVLKPEQDAGGCSVDAVFMDEATGPWHTHLLGEVCLLLPASGSPLFDGQGGPWMVLPAGSRHAPRVAGGSMLILYWWPEGAVKWG